MTGFNFWVNYLFKRKGKKMVEFSNAQTASCITFTPLMVSPLLCFISDDHGWEVCQQHLGPLEKCHPGDSEEKQQWAELWGALQERLHHGPTQARREALHRPEGGGHRTSHQQSKSHTSLSCLFSTVRWRCLTWNCSVGTRNDACTFMRLVDAFVWSSFIPRYHILWTWRC